MIDNAASAGTPLLCPWCGPYSSVYVRQLSVSWWIVKCDVCENHYANETREMVVAWWNRRPAEASLRSANAELEAEITQLKQERYETKRRMVFGEWSDE